MKKVIDGKTYNTDTAKLIVAKDSNLPHNDLDYWYEELYQTKDGDYFIYGEGGAASFFLALDPLTGLAQEKTFFLFLKK